MSGRYYMTKRRRKIAKQTAIIQYKIEVARAKQKLKRNLKR